MRKPNNCTGCPFYGSGQGFIQPEINNHSPILLVGGHPESDDIRGIHYTGFTEKGESIKVQGKPGPFRSYRGYKLGKFGYEGVNKDYMIRCLPPSYYSDETLHKAAMQCNRAYRVEPESTELIVAHGEIAWDGLLNQFTVPKNKGTIESGEFLPLFEWRGFLAPKSPVTKLPIYGVNDLQGAARDKVERYTSKKDWAKIPRILDGSWPIPEPEEVIVVTRSTPSPEIDAFYQRYLSEATTPLVVDTEYTIKDKFLRLFGCGYHTTGGQEYYLQLYWSNSQNPEAPRKVVVDWMFDLAYNTELVKHHQGFLFQNAAADNPVQDLNWRAYGQWGWPLNFHDTMLMHAKVESELPHSMMFQESIASRRAKKKHLSKIDELTYHLGDLSTTLDMWHWNKAEMTPGMWEVYETQDLKVMPLVYWPTQNGIRVDHTKVEPLYEKLKGYMSHATSLAELYVGKGEHFNLNSDQQCKEWLYEVELFETIKDRKTRKATINNDALLRLRQRYAKEENVWEVTETDEQWNPTILEERIFQGQCHPLLECKAAFNYYEDKIAKYIRTQLFDRDGSKLLRVYPSISIHAQATGRHSTTAPPLAQWPDELQDLLTPDPGWMWLGGDFEAQEIWLYSCMIHDEKTLEALKKGYDTHSMSMCDFFGWAYPDDLRKPYKDSAWCAKYGLDGKKNPYRDWSKANALAIRYMKDEDKLHLTPGSRSLGVDREMGTEMGKRFLEMNPAIKQYRDSMRGTHPKEAITFAGRVRRMHSTGSQLMREYNNSPHQGGGADLLNHTIIRATSVDPEVIHYVYGVHDSFKFTIPVARRDELIPQVKAAILEPYDVFGHSISFPVEWKEWECTV